MTQTLRYDFLNNPSLVPDTESPSTTPDLSITRATKATVVKSDGLIHEVSAGVARFTGATYSGDTASGTSTKGLLVEEARTQLAKWTEDASNAVWVASNITVGSDSVTAPDGSTNTNVRLTASAGNGTLLQSVTSASATRAYSVYMKRVTGTGNIDITVDGGSTWTTKTLTASWQRFDISQAAVTDPSFGVRIVTSGDEIDFWGSQLETGAFATSYISNNSATASVTRNADTVSTTDVSWVGTEHTFYTRNSLPVANSSQIHPFELSDNSTGKRVTLYRSTGDDIILFCANAGTQANVVIKTDLYNDLAEHEVAATWATDDFTGYADGTAAATPDTSGSVPTGLTHFYIGSSYNGNSNFWNGHIAEIRYYNTRLTNAQLEDMSNGVFP